MKRKLIASILGIVALAGTIFVMTSCDDSKTTPSQNEKMKHIVNFHSKGGSTVENQEVETYGLIQKPANPSLEGYVFGGWYLDSDCLVEWIFDTDIVTENITLYAKWDLEGFFVLHFNTKGGSAVAGENVELGSKIKKPTDPTREGYTFDNWYQDEECTILWDFEKDTIKDNTTLYANWIKNEDPAKEYWTVTIDLDNGTTPTTKKVEKGQKLTGVANPTKDGYTFAGWKANGAAWSMETAITADITIVAQWEEDEKVDPIKEYWTVTIDLDNGTTPTTKKVEKGQKLTGVANPTKDGYIFKGWKANGADWSMETAITADITIVAQWEKDEQIDPTKEYWTVTIDLDNGTTPTTKKVEKGQKLTGVANPTKEGYTFAGWKANGAAWTMDTAITANITIVAQWTKNGDP
ncbi:MAG: InlB B-repeat-containing protein, partial [Anaeroplasmataceae bacterium]|nr:InlB B-repeat-containing protein [Anaeroplasmataceae bacterium]